MKVVITGMGVLSSLGNSVDDFFGNFVTQLQPAKVESPEPETPPAALHVADEQAVQTVAETVAPTRKAWLVFALVALIIVVLAALSKGIFLAMSVPNRLSTCSLVI